VVSAVRGHRHAGGAMRMRRNRRCRMNLAGVNTRRFEKRGVEPHGPQGDQGSEPERVSHNL